VLRSASPEGTVEKFSDLTFHGGPGTVLEFRLFGRDSLERDCRAAGFSLGLVYGERAIRVRNRLESVSTGRCFVQATHLWVGHSLGSYEK
jgi:hypothetical protein